MTNSNHPDQPPTSTEGEATQKQVTLPVSQRAERFDAFLSHNSKDKVAVRKLKQRLESDGLKVWFDERELQAGDELHKAIAEGLDQSRVCAVFIGSEGFGPWHDWEKGLAITKHVTSPDFRLIPVVLPRGSKPKSVAKEVPLELSNLLWVEFTKLDEDEPYQRLKDGILGRGSDFMPRAFRQIEDDTETNITPRGLRSFEEDDKHFFLRLVAGPRDHRGLPVSIAFWKNRLEQVDPDKTFRVGLLFGPSGCGKSSLVKAGLLPRLHQYVKTIYLAATPDRTEQQLLSAVRKQVPELPSDLGLVESLAHLTSHPDVLKDFKLVIVLDQFEQWLHSKVFNADTELIAALRHCDAANLQAVVMVRADFYVETHRFFEQLNGVKIQDDINADLIDLFDRDHARNVLLEYGRACGRFTDPQSLNSEEESFLAETLDQLQDSDQRLVAVQLALFADLMKNKPWTGAVLKKLGGATGVGRAFLEENFDAKTANPTHKIHRKAAVAILKELLPPRGAGIKGTSKPKSELMQAASYQSRPADFEGLLGVLLNDLKLISPVAADEDSAATESPAVDPRYQLSHDYLVPSLRDWLTAKDRESWRGRARLLLEERTTEWLRDGENSRHFPSLIQWLQIQCGVPRRHRSPASRRLLRKTIRHYAVRTSLVIAVILAPVVAWFGKEFCTFQAGFADGSERAEMIITRRFDPLPDGWKFRQGTWIFKDELRDDDAKDKINDILKLNVGLSPQWSPLAALLVDARLGLAEIEWLDRSISAPAAFVRNQDVLGFERVDSVRVIQTLVATLKDQDLSSRTQAAECLEKLV